MSEEPTPLDFLKAVYCNEGLELHVRMRAAIEAAPYVHPKLGAIATTNLSGEDFAVLLDRAIERSGKGQEVKQIDLTPEGPVRRRPKEARG
jgi:hypothetical protein